MKLYKQGVPRQGTFPPVAPQMARWVYAAAAMSDVGCVRRNNEDNFLLDGCINENFAMKTETECLLSGEQRHIAGVFDGIGGGEQGEQAALLTARTFRNAQQPCRAGEPDRILREAFQIANRQVLKLREETGAFGTTAAVVCTDGDRFKTFHLGDSRVYLLRDGGLFQLTRDHTLAQIRIAAGFYREDDPMAAKDRNRLTEYVGRDWTGEETAPEESRWIRAQSGDCLLLCSDGLHGMCSDREIQRILAGTGTPREKAGALTALARERGGTDNITCVCMEYRKE